MPQKRAEMKLVWLRRIVATFALAVSAQGVAAAPFVRNTVLGDDPALEYRPEVSISDPSDPQRAADRALLENAERSTLDKTGTPTQPTVRTRVPARQEPDNSSRKYYQAPTVLPGVNEPGITMSPSDDFGAPLADQFRMDSIDDLRFVDEADSLAADFNRTFEESTPDPEEALAAARQNDDRTAAAVAEAARKAREQRIDTTMQSEIASFLESTSEEISFKFVPIEDMDDDSNQGGVLGLTRVVKSGLDDELEFDEENHLVAQEASGKSSRLVQWVSAAEAIDPAMVAANDLSGLATLGSFDAATSGLMNRLTSDPSAANSQQDFMSSFSARTNFGVAGILDQSALGRSGGGGTSGERPNRVEGLSLGQFLGIVRQFLFRPQVILAALATLAIFYVVSRASRVR